MKSPRLPKMVRDLFAIVLVGHGVGRPEPEKLSPPVVGQRYSLGLEDLTIRIALDELSDLVHFRRSRDPHTALSRAGWDSSTPRLTASRYLVGTKRVRGILLPCTNCIFPHSSGPERPLSCEWAFHQPFYLRSRCSSRYAIISKRRPLVIALAAWLATILNQESHGEEARSQHASSPAEFVSSTIEPCIAVITFYTVLNSTN